MRFPKRSRLRLKALKARARRPRRPHKARQPGQRMRAFGINRKRYLIMVPLLLLCIAAVGLLKAPDMVVNRFRAQEPSQVNPLMGWAPDASTPPEEVTIPHSLVYATLTWRELEPEEGVYDFAAFEEKNHLEAWWALGKQLVLRFVMDVPGSSPHMDIPDWLYEAMGQDAGSAYENSLGQGFSPNYNSRLLQSRHEAVLSALGQRYDQHAGVAFIEMGSLGHNGSWQVEGVEDEWAMPPAEELLSWAWHYQAAFPNTPILMSAPYQPARVMGLGLYNEHLGDEEKSWAWLDTIEYGGYDGTVGAELRPMPATLSSAPSGARIDGAVDQNELFSVRLRALIKQLTMGHTTYLSGVDLEAAQQNPAAISLARSVMGYQLWVREARFPSRIRAGYRLKVQLDMRNDGVQAFSQSWPVELALLKEDELVYREITTLDIRQITPGAHRVDLTLDVPRGLEGDYQLTLAILRPDTLSPAVALCMNGQQTGLRQFLGELRITP